jgi:hypothetical protein
MEEDIKEVKIGRCDEPPYIISMSDQVFQAIKGNCFFGQTKLMMFGENMKAWGGLINPPESHVNLYINIFTVSNFSTYPFCSQVWLNANMATPCNISNKVTPTNTALQPMPRPRVQLQFAESVTCHPSGGVNPFNRIISPRSTIEDEKGGSIIIPPGGSFLIYLVPPGACLVRARVAFGWWEEKFC